MLDRVFTPSAPAHPTKKLPKLSASNISLEGWNALAAAAPSTSFELLGTPMRLEWAGHATGIQGASFRFDLMVDETPCTLVTDSTFLTDLLNLHSWAPLGTPASGSSQALVVELALSPLLSHVESTFGRKITFLKCTPILTVGHCVHALSFDVIGLGEAPTSVTVWSEDIEEFADLIVKAWGNPAAPRAFDVPITLQICTGGFSMPKAQVQSVQTGDCVSFGAKFPNQRFAMSGPAFCVPVQTSAGSISPTGPAIDHSHIFTTHAENSMTTPSDTPLNPDVILTVEVDRRTISLSELNDLNAGKVLKIEPATPEHMYLCANGKRIAKGRLVELSDASGFQVTEFI